MKTAILAALAGLSFFALTQIVRAQVEPPRVVSLPALCGNGAMVKSMMQSRMGINMSAMDHKFVGVAERNRDSAPLKVWFDRGEDGSFVNYVETPEGNICVLYYGSASHMVE